MKAVDSSNLPDAVYRTDECRCKRPPYQLPIDVEVFEISKKISFEKRLFDI